MNIPTAKVKGTYEFENNGVEHQSCKKCWSKTIQHRNNNGTNGTQNRHSAINAVHPSEFAEKLFRRYRSMTISVPSLHWTK